MNDKTKQALELAMGALEEISSQYMSLPKNGCMALAAIKEALAEQPAQQEPVARSKAYDMIDRFLRNNLNSDEDYAEYSAALDSLYTSPPASKPWVGLTEEQKAELVFELFNDGKAASKAMYLLTAHEAKLREKNS